MKTAPRYMLMLEDDADDRHITQTFFKDNGYDIDIEFLTNSDELMPYLECCENGFKDLPCMVLLDKNLPAGGGMRVLKDLKSHPVFRMIPVVMLSGTGFPHEVDEAYRQGASSFIIKPLTYELTIKKIQGFLHYWFDTVEFPLAVPVEIGSWSIS